MNKEIQKIIDDRVTAAYGRGVLAGRIQEINRQIDEEEKERDQLRQKLEDVQ